MKAINSLDGNRWRLMSSTSVSWLLAHESRGLFRAETSITLSNLTILNEKIYFACNSNYFCCCFSTVTVLLWECSRASCKLFLESSLACIYKLTPKLQFNILCMALALRNVVVSGLWSWQKRLPKSKYWLLPQPPYAALPPKDASQQAMVTDHLSYRLLYNAPGIYQRPSWYDNLTCRGQGPKYVKNILGLKDLRG